MLNIKLKRKSKGDIIFNIFLVIFMILFVIVTLYPILNTLAISFNDGIDAVRGGVYLWPRMFTLKNYETVLSNSNLKQAAFISVSRTLIGTVTHVFLTAMLAYILSRKEFVFKKQLSFIYVLTMYVSGGMIPGYILIKKLGLLNNFLVYIIPGLVSAFNMIVIRTYINGLPDSLVESAKIDGASEMRVFWTVIIPLCKPAWITLAILSFQTLWGATGGNFIYSENLKPISYSLSQIIGGGIARTGVASVVSLIMMVVPVTVFVISQSNVIETMATSGMKD